MIVGNRLFISFNLLCLLVSTCSYPSTQSSGKVISGYSTLTISRNYGLSPTYVGNRHKYRADDHTLSSSAVSTVVDSESEAAKSHFSVMPIFGSYRYSKSNYSPRVQRLKDLSLQKEILKDVTAAEFALRIEVSASSEPQETAST